MVGAVLLSFIMATSAPCADTDLPCVKRLLLEKTEEALSLGRELGLTQKQAEILTKQVTALESALNVSAQALEANRARWYRSPELWLGVGVIVGISLTVLAAWAVVQVGAHVR